MDILTSTADTRRADPLTSHNARDKAITSGRVAALIEQALQDADGPRTADQITALIKWHYGQPITGQRVRTVLKENDGGPWERLDTTGLSDNGNPAHLWAQCEGRP